MHFVVFFVSCFGLVRAPMRSDTSDRVSVVICFHLLVVWPGPQFATNTQDLIELFKT